MGGWTGRTPAWVAVLCTGLALIACAPVPVRSSPGRLPSEPPAPAPGGKSLTIALAGEPRVLVTTMGLGNQPNLGGDIRGAVHDQLATLDDRGLVHPKLATE